MRTNLRCHLNIVLKIKIERVRLFIGLAEMSKITISQVFLHFGTTDRLVSAVHFLSPFNIIDKITIFRKRTSMQRK